MLKKTWIITCLLFSLFTDICWAKTKITHVQIQENNGITQIIFDMDALIYPEATLNKSDNHIIVTIPNESDWDIPEINESMVGFFEGYKIENQNGKRFFKADVLPGVKVVDSYSVNDDPKKPQFVIEISKDKTDNFATTPFSDPDEMHETTTVDDQTSKPVITAPEESIKELLIGTAPGFTVFKIRLGTSSDIKAYQKSDRVIIDVPQTDWSQVQAGEKFLGVMRDTKTGNIITIETPVQDWDDNDSSEKPKSMIIDYFVEEETPGKQQLIVRLEPDVHMISELRKKEGQDLYYVLKFKKKNVTRNTVGTRKNSQPAGLITRGTVAGNTPVVAAKRPSTIKMLQNIEAKTDPFKAESIAHKERKFRKEPSIVPQKRPIVYNKILPPKNPMMDRLSRNAEAQTSSEQGSTPDWVMDARKKIKRK